MLNISVAVYSRCAYPEVITLYWTEISAYISERLGDHINCASTTCGVVIPARQCTYEQKKKKKYFYRFFVRSLSAVAWSYGPVLGVMRYSLFTQRLGLSLTQRDLRRV